MKAYRVEDQRRGHGIWRDFDGKVNPVFSKLTQGKCKDMPMEDSEFYRHDGKQWFSATDTSEKLKAWFSVLDVVEMLDLGYSVFEFEISSCRVVSEYEICFTRDCIISQKEIDPRDIYGAEYEKALKTMSKEKQIKEMARVLNEEGKSLDTVYPEDCEKIARILYYEGYRKQDNLFLLKENGDIVNLAARSEWISVEDRLPEESGYFLVYIQRESEGFRVNAYYYCEDEMWENGDTMASSEYFGITHWMPLPEAPKGGAE